MLDSKLSNFVLFNDTGYKDLILWKWNRFWLKKKKKNVSLENKNFFNSKDLTRSQ